MKKVLFVATVTGHINAFHIPYLKWFKEQGYEVHVASKGNNQIDYCDKHFELPFERFPLKANNIKAYKQLKKIINDNEYEIIHCHTPVGGILTRLAAKKARKKGTRVIYTAHGFHFYKGAPLINWIIYYPIEKLLAKYTDCLITITNEDYELAKRKFKKIKQIEHVDGVGFDKTRLDIDMSEEERIDYRKKLEINKDDFVLSYVAELNKNKNQILLINAVKDLKVEIPNIKLLLIGNGPLRKEYQRKIIEQKLEDNIKLLGKRTDIGELLNITDIYVASSIREGLPVNVMEAMYVGLPIVATDNRGHRELIKNETDGLLIKNMNVECFKNSVINLYKDKANRKRLAKESKRKSAMYEKNGVIKKMQLIYEKPKIVLNILNSNRYSGAENVAITIIKKLKDYNIQGIYVSPKGDIEKRLQTNHILYEPIKKLNVKEINRICKKLKPDIIHAHDFTASVIVALSNFKGDIISHLHHNAEWIKKINIKTIIYKICIKRFKKIVLVSKAIKDEYIFKKSIESKMEILGNPIDIDKIRMMSKESSCDKCTDLIFIGRLSEEKNPILFIDIVNTIKKNYQYDITAVMLGDGILKEKCKKRIKELSLESNIKLLGFVENPFPILKNAKILCITSKWEGFGLVAAEALALGKPVVCSNVGGLKEIVNNKCGKLCDNLYEYIEEIMKLIEDEEYYKDKRECAIKISNELNNVEEYIKKLRKVYE